VLDGVAPAVGAERGGATGTAHLPVGNFLGQAQLPATLGTGDVIVHGDSSLDEGYGGGPGRNRCATPWRSTNSAPAFWTRSQIRSRVLKPGSTTPRQDGCARKSYTPPVAITWLSAWPTASRNQSSFHLPVRNATTSLGGLMGISTRPPGYANGC